MPILLYVFAALLMIVVPLLAAAAVFFMRLPRWIDKILLSDPHAQDRLKLEVSEESLGWTVASDGSAAQRLPYGAVTYAAFTALVVTVIETIAFAHSSAVPQLWLAAGNIVAATVVVLTIALVWILKRPFRHFVDRQLEQHADERFSFAAQTLFATAWTCRQIDKTYARIDLRAQSDALEQSRWALLKYTRLGFDSALAEVIGIKNKADHDLRNLETLARLLTSAWTVLDQIKPELQEVAELQGAVVDIEKRLRSRELADALEDARWPDAHTLLEKIGSDLGRLADIGKHNDAMPESVQDACRLLNVGDKTPIENIKAVVNAFRRVWHPDLARDDLERQQNNLRMQRINVAWDIIQTARTH
jgi:hypothetical protein